MSTAKSYPLPEPEPVKKGKRKKAPGEYVPDKSEHYVTPEPVIRQALALLPELAEQHERVSRILDAGCGDDARWGRLARELVLPHSVLDTIEKRVIVLNGHMVERCVRVDTERYPHLQHVNGLWYTDDFLVRAFPQKYDLIVTNPPFSISLPWVLKCLKLLRKRGWLVALLPAQFANGNRRWEQLHSRYTIWKRGCLVDRPGFTNDQLDGSGSDIRDCDIFIWQQGFEGQTRMCHIPPVGKVLPPIQNSLLPVTQ
jgi:hypothetical protein